MKIAVRFLEMQKLFPWALGMEASKVDYSQTNWQF